MGRPGILWSGVYSLRVLLLIEKWVPALQSLPSFLRHFYVLLLICLSFVLFNADSFAQAGQDFANLFGFAGLPFMTAETWYYLRSFALLFLAGFIGSTPLVKNTALKLRETKLGGLLEFALMVGLLTVCTAYLVDGSFSPFLYFRF